GWIGGGGCGLLRAEATSTQGPQASRSQHGQALGPDHTVCRALCVLPPSTTWSREVSVPGGTGRTGGIRHAAGRAEGRSCPGGVAQRVSRPAPGDCRTETFLKRGAFRKVGHPPPRRHTRCAL